MAAQVGQYAANKYLKKHMKGYAKKKVESGNDPYFAMIEDPRRPGKLKKVKKQIPAYIPEHDAAVLASVRRKAYRLDMCLFNFMGIRFGWEAVIGLIPFAGDAIGFFFAYMIIRKCMQIDGGLSNTIRTRMMLNIAIDFAIGLVPFIGDLADAAYKCNTRNLRLLEVVLDKKYKGQQADERDQVGIDHEKRRKNRESGIFTTHDPPPATVFEDFSEDELREQDHVDGVAPSQPAAVGRKDRRSWFGGKKQNAAPTSNVATTQPSAQNMATNSVPLQQQTGTVRR